MKICFVCPHDPAQALQQALLARALARRGYQVSQIAGAPWAGLWAAAGRADAELYYASGAGAQALMLALFCILRNRRLVLRYAPRSGFALRGAHLLVVDSAAEQRQLARAGLRARVAGPLVEPVPRTAERDIDALWMGTVRGEARPDRALSLARRLPQARVHMAAAPDANEEVLFREIRRMAGDIANLSFHAAPPRREALALLARAKLLLWTADDEALPHAWLQAWASGVPVAALGDAQGLIARAGLGVVAGSPAALLEAARTLLEDQAAWEAASARCRRYMARAHSEARVVRAYAAAFESARRRAAPAFREHPA